jgi:hypothetical protein
MATKKNEEVEAPKLSKLPLPLSDQPLVIDLPDGQKLVIGKMTQGSVIEVATWRGTGRPDSRTSRLMLGMSVADSGAPSVTSDSNQSDASQAPAGKQEPLDVAKALLQKLVKNVVTLVQGAVTKISELISQRTASKKRPSAPKSIEDVKAHPVSEDAEIEAWLNKITEKAEKKSARAAIAATKGSTVKKTPSKRTSAAKKPSKKR